MKLSIATGLVLALASTSIDAFAPSNTFSSPQLTALFAEEKKNSFLPQIDAKAAASLVAASVFAFSTVGVTATLPGFVEPAYAAKVEKVVQKKLTKEEKEFQKAKSNVDLAKSTLESYQKLNTDAKTADKKAKTALTIASKNEATAKKAYTTVADKLSSAKKQKMPESAVKELSADAASLKSVLNEKEKILSSASKTAESTSKQVASTEKGIKESQKAIKKVSKNFKKAEKTYSKYQKKVNKQLKAQQTKLKKIQGKASQLKSAKERETKELKATEKALEAESKALEAMKAK